MSNFFKAPTSNYVQTTLNGSISDSATTITLTDASKLQAPGYVILDRLDSLGVSTPASREIVYYTGISSNNLTGCSRGADGSTAQAHSDGARVETMITVGMWNDLVGIVSKALDSTGSKLILSNATITGSLNVSGASVVGIDVSNLNNIIVTGYNRTQNIAVSSLASIARTETNFVNAINGAFSSIASIARIEYTVARMALNSNASGGIACDFDTANLFTRVLNASTTISLTNWSTGDKGVVRLVQGISGATVAWYAGSGATIKWSNGTSPILTYQLNKIDVFGFIGTTDTQIDGFLVGSNV